jgi:hypothetical protein
VTHETLDQIKLAQHKLIAKKLQENPEAILALARRNLRLRRRRHNSLNCTRGSASGPLKPEKYHNISLTPLPIVPPRPNPVPNATHSFHETAF